MASTNGLVNSVIIRVIKIDLFLSKFNLIQCFLSQDEESLFKYIKRATWIQSIIILRKYVLKGQAGIQVNIWAFECIHRKINY